MKLETLRQNKVYLEGWKRYTDSREKATKAKMQKINSDRQQSPPVSHVLETSPNDLPMDDEFNSSTIMYGDNNQFEIERAESETKRQQDEQMQKLNVDFKANLLIAKKLFECQKKELEQKLEELHKAIILSQWKKRDRTFNEEERC